MAVGYYSGSSTGPNDLIDKFRIAALAEGWTVNAFAAVGAGYRLHIQKTASDASTVMYFNLRSAVAEYGTTITENNNNNATTGLVTGLLVNGSRGYDAGQDWDTQTTYPQNRYDSNKSFAACMTAMSTSAIPAYYFYFVGDSVHIVVETTAGKFQFMSFGMLYKQGTVSGGLYFCGSYSCYDPVTQYAGTYYSPWYFTRYLSTSTDRLPGAVYVDVDSVANWRIDGLFGVGYDEIVWPCVSGAGTDNNPNGTKVGLGSFFWSHSPSSYNSMAAMCPIYTLLKRSDGNYSNIGWPEGVRFLNTTMYDNAEEVSYGDETWMVFHADSMAVDPINMYCGFAFLKDDGS